MSCLRLPLAGVVLDKFPQSCLTTAGMSITSSPLPGPGGVFHQTLSAARQVA
ncbi:MAG TPA: hypothetical protein HPP57_05860 [Deltaproteobacteria bacterium]|nr:hypothetical protein [Deltaproteobacteria bacterium]